MTTTVDVRNRVMALAERIQLPSTINAMHVYRTEEECSFSPDDLPAAVVRIAVRPRQFGNVNFDTTYEMRFEILIGLYVSHICDESYSVDMDAQDSAEVDAQTVYEYFVARPTLSMNDDVGIVDSARIAQMAGPHTMPTTGSTNKNRGVQFRMEIVLRNRVPITDE